MQPHHDHHHINHTLLYLMDYFNNRNFSKHELLRSLMMV